MIGPPPPDPAAAESRISDSWSRSWIAAVLVAVCLLCYLANGRTLSLQDGGDTIPNRLLPFSILGFHTLTLDPFREEFARHGPIPWYVVKVGGSILSYYPVGSSFVALPAYVPFYLGALMTGRADAARLFQLSRPVEKFAASLIAAVSVAVLFFLLLRRTTRRYAIGIALLFGLSTSMWGTASQMLWQHGPAVLSLLLAFLFFDRWATESSGWELLLGGFFLGLMFVVRPQAIVFGAAGLLFVLTRSGSVSERLRRLLTLCGGALIAELPNLLYNLHYFGHVAGAYQGHSVQLHFAQIPAGLLGMFLSPNRGFLIYTPIALVGIAGAAGVIRNPTRDPLVFWFLVGAVLFTLLHAAFDDWPGGWSFGPRYMTETLPVLALAAARLPVPAGRAFRALLVAATLWSFAVQLNGAFMYPASRWDPRVGPDHRANAWNFRHLELWEDFQAWRFSK